MKAQIFKIKNIAVELIWNSTTADDVPNLLKELGINETSELDPYDSKRRYLRDVFSRVSDKDFLKFCEELKGYYKDTSGTEACTNEAQFQIDLSRFKSALNLLGAGYSRISNSNQLFFGALEKPDFWMEADSGLLRDRTDSSLIYKGPYRSDGILNSDLKKWFDNSNLKINYSNLIGRLEESIKPKRELDFFRAYYSVFCKPNHNALLPQVWLNWEPISRQQRGSPSVPQRFDFLWWGPNNKCAVIELDGSSHIETDGNPDETKYVHQIASDRDLTLRGFQVFRFGNKETAYWKHGNILSQKISDFFDRLLEK